MPAYRRLLALQADEPLLAAPTCVCGNKKYNPSPCGIVKPKKGDVDYQIDKFDDVVQLMRGGLVVSLDPSLEALNRIWVVAEVGQAMKSQRTCFRIAMGLSEDATGKLLRGDYVVRRD